jgi:divalent metal cation (Fe/Co/Zn/Cd) transporter
MDEAQPEEIVQAVRKIASDVPGVMGIEKCFVRKMGFEYFVDIHVVVDAQISVVDGHRIAHHVKDAIMASNPAVYNVLTHVEPHQYT